MYSCTMSEYVFVTAVGKALIYTHPSLDKVHVQYACIKSANLLKHFIKLKNEQRRNEKKLTF